MTDTVTFRGFRNHRLVKSHVVEYDGAPDEVIRYDAIDWGVEQEVAHVEVLFEDESYISAM